MSSGKWSPALALVLTACGGSDKPDMVGKPPTDDQLVQARPAADRIQIGPKKKEARNDFPEPQLLWNGWPYNEEGHDFTVEWSGGAEPIPLHASPSLNAPVETQTTLKRGQKIRWTQTAVAIFYPSTYRVSNQFLMEGFVYGDGYRAGGETFSQELSPGEVVGMYQYAGEGMCIMGVRQTMVEAVCPTEENFKGNFQGPSTAAQFQPSERIWWLYVNTDGGSGWMVLDDRAVVDIE